MASASASTLCAAAARGDAAAVEALLAAGASVDAPREDGLTPLMLACAFSEDPATARRLLAAGADVTSHAHTGFTALSCAVRAGRRELALELLDLGADPAAEREGPWRPSLTYGDLRLLFRWQREAGAELRRDADRFRAAIPQLVLWARAQ